MRLVFLGPPGAGKGTQVRIISKILGVPSMAMGDVLRMEVASGSELGVQAKSYMDRGELVPDYIVIKIVEKWLNSIDAGRGFILDGYPRNVRQARELDEMLGRMGFELTAAVYLEVPEDEVVRRLSGRLTCKKCGAVYHIEFNPPKEDLKCDVCRYELYQREDDREDVVRQRFRVYTETTKPVLDYYNGKGKLIVIDGLGSIEEVKDRIMKRLRGATSSLR
ncbi:MAG: adenylate kinase [Candidatus Nezhaarchaeota archaeon]|nr:adenylate kinase [Candidatus Nezhaarchaeota archaeon]MCX8141453.1 adenylate kinase [Candidatus Nezhaarchaeota archaeon]MDW8049719.1 adenylate kinase [Nitrososphaerota archaeon]